MELCDQRYCCTACKVKVNVDLYSASSWSHLKALRYSTCSQGISQFYLHTPPSSANGMNHTCLCLPSLSWYSFTDPGGMESWVGLTQFSYLTVSPLTTSVLNVFKCLIIRVCAEGAEGSAVTFATVVDGVRKERTSSAVRAHSSTCSVWQRWSHYTVVDHRLIETYELHVAEHGHWKLIIRRRSTGNFRIEKWGKYWRTT